MSKDERNTYTIQADESLGEVKIADEVVAMIAGLAAMEVEGVASSGGETLPRELIEQAWDEVVFKGVKVTCWKAW